MGDNYSDPRQQNQQYYQHGQQVPDSVFQQQQWQQNAGYGYPNNQMYGNQPNYPNQYQQGEYYEEEYDEVDYDNLAEIDKEINKETEEEEFVEKGIASDSGTVPSAFQGQLSAHAKEFWFPECRNCPCCSGFKHGCKCCKGAVNTCTDAACVDQEFKQQVSAQIVSAPAAAPSSAPAFKFTPPGSAPAGGGVETCRFEAGPGGCRYGAACRFKHSLPPTSSGAAPSSAGPPGAKARCSFFAKGYCQNGDSCRFGHY